MAVSVVSMPTQASCVRTMGQASRDIAFSSRRHGARAGVAISLVSIGAVIVLSRWLGIRSNPQKKADHKSACCACPIFLGVSLQAASCRHDHAHSGSMNAAKRHAGDV